MGEGGRDLIVNNDGLGELTLSMVCSYFIQRLEVVSIYLGVSEILFLIFSLSIKTSSRNGIKREVVSYFWV